MPAHSNSVCEREHCTATPFQVRVFAPSGGAHWSRCTRGQTPCSLVLGRLRRRRCSGRSCDGSGNKCASNALNWEAAGHLPRACVCGRGTSARSTSPARRVELDLASQSTQTKLGTNLNVRRSWYLRSDGPRRAVIKARRVWRSSAGGTVARVRAAVKTKDRKQAEASSGSAERIISTTLCKHSNSVRIGPPNACKCTGPPPPPLGLLSLVKLVEVCLC